MQYIIILLLITITIVITTKLCNKKYKNNLKKQILSFYNEIESLKNEYIPYSVYESINKKYKDLYEECRKRKSIKYLTFVKKYRGLRKHINSLNNKYVNKEIMDNEEYFDNLFDFKIDLEQRKAIVTDDDYNLVIAGAGSGKTSTMIGKINYLVEKKSINPNEILSISFTNNAVNNFKDRLKYDEIECTTFHKLGLNILSTDAKKDIASTLLETIIHKYLTIHVLEHPEELKEFINFLGLYLHPFNDDEKMIGEQYEYENGFDLETLKSKLLNSKQLKEDLFTLNQEKVKSYEELVIANYLFLNGINYEYEKPYEHDTASKYHRQYKPDFYLTDYNIYLEHFGINRQNRCPQYDATEERRYLEGIKFKRKTHKINHTKLIETYSYYFKEGTIFKELEKLLKNNNVTYKPIDYNEIHNAIVMKTSSSELISFTQLIHKFISLFKGNNYDISKFDEFLEDATTNNSIRNQILLSIFKKIYLMYQKELLVNDQIDFNDMINLATKKINDDGYFKKLSYIIVDEFQDISYSRYNLLKAIISVTKAKLVAVGDDWQSIFRFSGCDLDLFVNFENYFSHPQLLFIHNTHRNSQELIDIAGQFIMKNEKGQISKKLISLKHEPFPLSIYYYVEDITKALNDAIKDLKETGCQRIAILGRNRHDIYKIIDPSKINKKLESHIDLSKIFNYPVDYYTVHASKGMEFDGVIGINLRNAISGFPNKMSDDPILNYVTLTKDDFIYEEERRLFYVLLTRTKTRCSLLTPTFNSSVFINELVELKNPHISITESESDERTHNPHCPICKKGRLVIRTNTKTNSKFISCTNYPKCDFRNNNIDIIENNIPCPRCGSFLVERNGPRGKFYGCINYPFCTQTAQISDKTN